MFDPLTILTAAVPLLTEAGKAGIDIIKNKFAPDTLKPSNVAELVQMQSAQMELFKAMNSFGGESYPWVEAIIKLQRPVVVCAIIATWVFSHIHGGDTETVDNAASAVGFYLFADRTLFYTRKMTK